MSLARYCIALGNQQLVPRARATSSTPHGSWLLTAKRTIIGLEPKANGLGDGVLALRVL